MTRVDEGCDGHQQDWDKAGCESIAPSGERGVVCRLACCFEANQEREGGEDSGECCELYAITGSKVAPSF